MAVDRIARVNQLLRREIAEVLFRVIKSAEVNLAAVTVTQVSVSRDLRSARVGVSVLGQAHEQERVLALLRRCRADIQSRVNKDVYLRYTPRLTFELDASVERGDHMLALLDQMAEREPAAPDLSLIHI